MPDSLATLQNICAVPSKDCDKRVEAYCAANPNDKDFCGCSTNVLVDITDPKLGNSPVKCWARSCTQNVNAYQFYSFQTDPCPDICIDQSSITAIGSNITDSSFNQAGCNSTQNIQQNDTALKTTISQLYEYGLGFGIGVIIMFICLLLSISVTSSMIPES
jgi:hypothetical protein